jgi:hypothetical protein
MYHNLKDDYVSIHFFNITHIGGRKTRVKVWKWQGKEGKEGRKEKERMKARGRDEHTGVERKTAFQQTFSISGN